MWTVEEVGEDTLSVVVSGDNEVDGGKLTADVVSCELEEESEDDGLTDVTVVVWKDVVTVIVATEFDEEAETAAEVVTCSETVLSPVVLASVVACSVDVLKVDEVPPGDDGGLVIVVVVTAASVVVSEVVSDTDADVAEVTDDVGTVEVISDPDVGVAEVTVDVGTVAPAEILRNWKTTTVAVKKNILDESISDNQV